MVKVSVSPIKMLSNCTTGSVKKCNNNSASGRLSLAESDLMETSSLISEHSSISDDSEVSNFYSNLYTAGTFDLDMAHISLSPRSISPEIHRPSRIEEEKFDGKYVESSIALRKEPATTHSNDPREATMTYYTPDNIHRDIKSILSMTSDEDEIEIDDDFNSASESDALSCIDERDFYFDRAIIERELDSICSEHMDLSTGVEEDTLFSPPVEEEDNANIIHLGRHLQSQTSPLIDSRDEESSVRAIPVHKEASREPVPAIETVLNEKDDAVEVPSQGKNRRLFFRINAGNRISEDIQFRPDVEEMPERKKPLLNRRVSLKSRTTSRRKICVSEQPLLKESPFARKQRSYRFSTRKPVITEQLKRVLHSPFQMRNRIERQLQYQMCSDVSQSHMEESRGIYFSGFHRSGRFVVEENCESPRNYLLDAQIDQMMAFTPISSKVHFVPANNPIQQLPPPPPSSPVNFDSSQRLVYRRNTASEDMDKASVECVFPVRSISLQTNARHSADRAGNETRGSRLSKNLKEFLVRTEVHSQLGGEERLDEALSTCARADPSPKAIKRHHKHQDIAGDNESAGTRITQNLSPHRSILDKENCVSDEVKHKKEDFGTLRPEGRSAVEQLSEKRSVDHIGDKTSYKEYLLRLKKYRDMSQWTKNSKFNEITNEGKDTPEETDKSRYRLDALFGHQPNTRLPKDSPSKSSGYSPEVTKQCNITSRNLLDISLKGQSKKNQSVATPLKSSQGHFSTKRLEGKTQTKNLASSESGSCTNLPRRFQKDDERIINQNKAKNIPRPLTRESNGGHINDPRSAREDIPSSRFSSRLSIKEEKENSFVRPSGNRKGVENLYSEQCNGKNDRDPNVRHPCNDTQTRINANSQFQNGYYHKEIPSSQFQSFEGPKQPMNKLKNKDDSCRKSGNEVGSTQRFPQSRSKRGAGATFASFQSVRSRPLSDQRQPSFSPESYGSKKHLRKEKSGNGATAGNSVQQSKAWAKSGDRSTERFEAIGNTADSDKSVHDFQISKKLLVDSLLASSSRIFRAQSNEIRTPIQGHSRNPNKQVSTTNAHAYKQTTSTDITGLPQQKVPPYVQKSNRGSETTRPSVHNNPIRMDRPEETTSKSISKVLLNERKTTTHYLDIIPKGPVICDEVDEMPLSSDTPKALLFWANAKMKARQESI